MIPQCGMVLEDQTVLLSLHEQLEDNMNHLKTVQSIGMGFLVLALTVGLTLSVTTSAFSHGGKTHREETFTAFQAVQKASQLYDRLLAAGKLSEGWETGLKTIIISTRKTGNKSEYVIQFETDKENPDSVYFFFSQDGMYSGSNFTGE